MSSPLATTNSREEKVTICSDWWNESHKHIINAEFSINNLPVYVEKSNLNLRKNFSSFIDVVNAKQIPFIISSAGIEEVIQISIADYKIPKLQILANKMVTDEKGKITDFREPIVHSYNKNGFLMKQMLQDSNVLLGDFVVVLVGDALSDLLMLEGIEPRLAYTIGFCNFEKNLQTFEANFDTVLERNASMDAVTETLIQILGSPTATEQLSLSPIRTMPPAAEKEIVTKILQAESILSLPYVKCRDRSVVEKKIEKIIADGIDQLVVISDFDYTLSRAIDDNGERCHTTYGVFDVFVDEIRPGLSQTLKDLKNLYYPIEFDPHMTIEEKCPHMEEWWRCSHSHIVSAGFTKTNIERFVERSNVLLRKGAEQWLRELANADVPLIVFSAGVGDIIETKLRQQCGKIPDNLHILANLMKYDENEVVYDFSEPLIHTFCKNSSVIDKAASFYPSVSSRPNVLLMGDSLGDVHMDVGVNHQGHTLRIGFLNFYSDDLLEKFLHGYDLVIINDQTINIPETITRMATAASLKPYDA
ncbi:unnamed protein product, partial [Mesorhabditis belari]|uniref:5'-nucleotidase n=1 Tax=Mesorhabditis belari TaxID=2138241 RepID=A0AAF3FDK1_9BILA